MALYPQLQSGIGNNGINVQLFPVEINRRLIKEFLRTTVLTNLIGDEMTRPIVRHNFKPGEGLAYRVNRLNAINYRKPVFNFDQRRGKEQGQSVDCDTVQCDKRTFQIKITGIDILKYGTPIDLPAEARSEIVSTYAKNLNWDLFNSMTVYAYPSMGWNPVEDLVLPTTTNCNVPGTLPSFDRSIPSFPTTRVQWQANQTFNTYLNAFQTPAATSPDGTGLSTQHLEELRQYADRGGSSPEIEPYVQPAFVKSKAGFPMMEYYYFAHPETLVSLMADPLFIAAALGRGTVTDDNQPQMINGADYFGKWRGINIYSVPDLYKYTFTSDDGNKRVACNLLICAGSLSLGYAEYPQFKMEVDDRESSIVYYAHEIRGQKMLQFPSRYVAKAGANAVVGSNPLVEQGVFFSFVSY